MVSKIEEISAIWRENIVKSAEVSLWQKQLTLSRQAQSFAYEIIKRNGMQDLLRRDDVSKADQSLSRMRWYKFIDEALLFPAINFIRKVMHPAIRHES